MRASACRTTTIDPDFVRDYPNTTNAELAARYGVSRRTVARWAASAGVGKSPAHRSATSRAASATRDPASVPRGESHYKWRGGRPWERFRDPAYLAWRRSVLERDDYRCQACGRHCRKYERGLAAHHIKSWADHPESRFDVNNGMTLCRECHLKLHGRERRPVAKIVCACGCGTLISAEDRYGRSRRFVNHHGKRGTTMPIRSREKLSAERRGRRLTAAHRASISQGLRTSTKRIGRPPKGT
jgi:HNH endonuclease